LEDEDKCLEAGINDYVLKPLKSETALGMIVTNWYLRAVKKIKHIPLTVCQTLIRFLNEGYSYLLLLIKQKKANLLIRRSALN